MVETYELESDRMVNLYILTWDLTGKNTDMYGATNVYKKNGEVYYRNELQPSSKVIQQWGTVYPADASNPLRYSDKFLPFLHDDELYHVQADMDVTPQESVGLEYRNSNKDDQLDQEIISLDLNLDFVNKNNADDYQISLVKFNNDSLTFRALYLAPQSFFANYDLKSHINHQYVDLIAKENHNPKGQIVILQRHSAINDVKIDLDNYNVIRVILVNELTTNQQLSDLIIKTKQQFKKIEDFEINLQDAFSYRLYATNK